MKNEDYMFIIHIGEMLLDAQNKYIISFDKSRDDDFYYAISDIICELIEFVRQDKED